MRRIATCLTALLVTASSAVAADAGNRWAGWYAGGNVSYGSTNFDWHDLDGIYNYTTGEQYLIGPGWDEVFKTDDSSLGLGVQLGYMTQMNENTLVGIEASLGLPGLKDDRLTCYDINPCEVKSKLSWNGALRARLGRAYGQFMPYIAAGLAFGNFKHSFTEGEENNPSTWPEFGGTSLGLSLGAGVDYSINDKWSLRGQVDYTKFADETEPNTFENYIAEMQVTRDVLSAQIGLNYKLGK
jgi:outer membrane immunogenic protein